MFTGSPPPGLPPTADVFGGIGEFGGIWKATLLFLDCSFFVAGGVFAFAPLPSSLNELSVSPLAVVKQMLL
jgi:hypothetical protein